MIKVMVAGILTACILCGCTRREQLVLDTGGREQPAEETKEAGQDGVTDAGTADGTAPAMQDPAANPSAEDGQQIPYAEGAAICVHVCGAVEKPGVYELPEGSRVFEAVREAGGFTAEADDSYVNQAQQLADGVKLVIPTVEQAKAADGSGTDSAGEIGIVEGSGTRQADGYGVSAGSAAVEGTEPGSEGKININTASEAQLCEIPGIGATRAAAIVAYRQQAGGFASPEDIMKVSGIKEGTYEKMKDRITVN